MEKQSTIKFSEHAQHLLAKYQDQVVKRDQKNIDELRAMTISEFLAKGIGTNGAPFELIGRMQRKGWINLSYNKNTSMWEILDNSYTRRVIAVEEVIDMLEAEE
jgi:hypothetical protein